MPNSSKPTTIGQLRDSGYRVLSVKDEMRQNLMRKMRAGDELFPGIVGYEETVIPQVENAILSGQDIILLGERGQAKTRIARSLINLLDEETPTIVGCEINDDPFHPVCRACRDRVVEEGDETPIHWISREGRYGEKLATPDITIADLVGEVDPIKVAEGRYLSDELTLHYGLIPRTNRGIFCINELPDLAERIQVGLLNIMEERDVQIRGYKIRLPLDVFVVASANPEDYTNRGRIITQLKDRLGSEIRTHYPRTTEHEIAIMEAESRPFELEGIETIYPDYMRAILAELTHLARRSPDISQKSGVSVRVSITNYENVMSNAVRRAIRLKERQAVPRVSDLSAVIASTAGKIELDTIGEVREDTVIEKLVRQSIIAVFRQYFDVADFEQLVAGFEKGLSVRASDMQPAMEYVN
ncbi:MAG TPA: sigma 54-interacting transcriptional regulator, partial [Ktedonobacterales bacterium]|nr:sigma 54-interacting transcriptional regulator [Ktedonobacterales bacterium]